MSGSLGHLNIQLTLEQINFQRNLEKSSQEAQRFTRQFQINFANAQRKAKQFSERTSQYLKNIEKASNSINSTAKWQLGFNISTELIRGAGAALKYAETNTELANRLRLVTDNNNQLFTATEAVFDISLRTNQAVSATSTIYQRFAKNADQLGLSQLEVAELTETVSKAVAMSGASAASAEAALMQFGQALASGELRGAELNSVMEQTPGLAEAIAKGLGVTVGQLRAMGKLGELDIPKVIEGLKKAKEAVDTDFEKRIITISQAFTNFETQLIKTIGEMDQGFGVSQNFAQGIEFAANNLDSLVKVAGTFVALGLANVVGGYANKKLESAFNTAKSTLEHQREAKSILSAVQAKRLEAQADLALLNEQYRLAQSERTRFALREQMKAQTQQIIALAQQEAQAKRNLITANSLASGASGILKNALGLIGGPTGAAMLAGSALFYFSEQAKQARDQALDTAGANEKLKQSYDGLSESALTKIIYQQIEDLANFDKQLAKTQAEISNIQTAHWQFGLELSDKSKQDIDKLMADLDEIGNNKSKNLEVLEKQLVSLGTAFLQNGKSVDDFKAKLKIIGVEANITEKVVAKLPMSVSAMAKSATQAENKTLDLSEAIAKLNEKSTTLAQKLEVAKLKQQGQAKTAYVLAGLYELLGKEGAEYNQVLIDIANGTITAANAADKAVGLSVETLNKLLQGKETLGKMFETENQTETIEQNIKLKTKKEKSSGGAKTDYSKQYTEQLTSMQQRLAELKANAEDIRLFGEPSQYQEVNKLTQDIAANAEKYKNFGAEGVAKLKEMAAQIDSAHQQVAIAQFGKSNQDKLTAMQFELELMGKTRQEQELMRYNNQLDIEAAKLKIGMTQENIALLDIEIAKLKEKHAQIQAEMEAKRASAVEGVKQSMQTIEQDVTNVAGNISNITVGAFNGMADAMTDLVLTGKANFADLAKSIIADITKMIIKMMIFNALKSAFGGTAFGFSNGGLAEHSKGGLVGFDGGGFTGLGGKYSPAGIVHKGEYVLTKEATSRIGLDYLNYLNYGNAFRGRGFANGGAVGAVNSLTSSYAHISNQRSPNVNVKVINNGAPVQAEVETKQNGEQLEITLELMKRVANEQISQHHNTFMRNRRLNGEV